MPKKTTIQIFSVDWEKLKKIKAAKDFPNYAETVGYVLQKYPEMIPVEIKPNATFRTAAELLKEKQLAPTKNNQFIQIGAVKKP
jgi:hypothetical protein